MWHWKTLTVQLLLIVQQLAEMDQPYATGTGRLAIPLIAPLPQNELFQFVDADTEGILLSILGDLGDVDVPLGQVAVVDFVRMPCSGGQKQDNVADRAFFGVDSGGCG